MDRRRKVAVTVEQCWHRVPGGTATSTLGTLRALAERDDVELVGVAARHGDPPDQPFTPPIEVAHLGLPRLALYEAWHALRWPSVESATGPVELVHATAIAVPPTDAPLVMTIHDLAFLANPSQATRHGLRFFKRGTELARRHADLVLVPSDATATECRAAGFDPERIRVVPWGVDIAPVHEADVVAARERHGLDRPYVLFVGTIEPRKNITALLRAYALLRERYRVTTGLVLAGGVGWQSEQIFEEVEQLDLTDHVTFLGRVNNGDLLYLYNLARCLAHPALYEGFGLTPLEAMASGTPVVVSNVSSLPEVVGDAGLLVDPNDVEDLAVALQRVLTDDALHATLREKGLARASVFSWQRAAQETMAIYQRALSTN